MLSPGARSWWRAATAPARWSRRRYSTMSRRQCASTPKNPSGPVKPVIRVKGEDEAVRVANDTEYGLSSAVFSRDIKRAMAVAARIEAGICHINGPTVGGEAQMPFGGVKGSGYGRFGGKASIAEFTDLHWVTIEDPASTTHSDRLAYRKIGPQPSLRGRSLAIVNQSHSWLSLAWNSVENDLLGKTAAGAVFQRDGSTVAFDDFLGDGEAQACARNRLPAAGIDAKEWLERLAQQFLRDARPAIGDGENGVIARRGERDAAALAVGGGVDDQIAQCPAKAERACLDRNLVEMRD
jgi:hypothetical protein